MYPEILEKLIEFLKMFPGVGVKSATRYAFTLLEKDEELLKEFAEVLANLKSKISKCPTCGFLCEDDKCPICLDNTRDNTKIMIVSYVNDVIAIEKTNSYKGLYHVLNGVISSSKGIYPEDLNLDSLFKRLDNVKEVIIATSPTMDGEMTALYLDKILKDKNILVTRLANGLPMGSNLDYADDLTLIKAMNNRRKMEE